MLLTPSQLAEYDKTGLVILPALFSKAECERAIGAFDTVSAQESPANIREKDSGAVRTAMALHQRDEVFAQWVKDERLVEPAEQLSKTQDLYVQQVKVNVKAAFEGEAWQWHYDFATHHNEDGVPAPLALNFHIFLDDVTEFNGPLHFIAGSHKHRAQPAFLDTQSTSYDLWCVEREIVRSLVDKGHLVSATGVAGTVLIFGDLMVHSSPPNLSPFDRRIFSLILNPVTNAYTRTDRPDYKHHRALSPVGQLDPPGQD
jgi:ectoine hydroxylase